MTLGLHTCITPSSSWMHIGTKHKKQLCVKPLVFFMTLLLTVVREFRSCTRCRLCQPQLLRLSVRACALSVLFVWKLLVSMVSVPFEMFFLQWVRFTTVLQTILDIRGELDNIIRIDFAVYDAISIFPDMDKPQRSGFPASAISWGYGSHLCQGPCDGPHQCESQIPKTSISESRFIPDPPRSGSLWRHQISHTSEFASRHCLRHARALNNSWTVF